MIGMIHTNIGFFRFAAALLACLALAVPAFGQEGKTHTLEPVKVSAQKREEDVQKVPQSVDVLDDVALEENRIVEFLDLQNIVPNMSFSSTGGTGTYSFIAIRGRSNCTLDVDSTVSVLVDGVPYDDLYSVANNMLLDIERVEVLRGPQSTLYGLNSEAGVINIITKEPTDTVTTKVFGEGGYWADADGSYRVGGSVSGPILEDRLKGRLALTTKHEGGYVVNRATDEPYNDSQVTASNGSLVFTPTDNLKISGGLSYTNLSGDAGYVYAPYDRAAAASLGLSYDEWEVDVDEEGYSDQETLGSNVQINYQFDTMEVTSITAYRKTRQRFGYDGDLTPTPGQLGFADNEFGTLTQELRLQSMEDEDSPFNWLVGYFLHGFERDMALGFNGTPAYSGTITGRSNAFFGQGTYRVMDRKLGFTLGLRQEWAERSVKVDTGMFNENSVDNSMFLPKFTVDYRATPEAMLYASVARGWRSGGVNLYGPNLAQSEFDKETCWAYEVGAKTHWMDNRLLLNLSAFYTAYDDFQDAVRINFMQSYMSNVPEVRMMGLEAEMDARLTEALQLTGGVGYVHARYEDAPDAVAGDFNGNSVAMVPDFDAHLALRYTFLENFYVRPEVRGVGTTYWDASNVKKQDPYMTCNLRAGYMKDNYEIYVYGQNLTNEYAFNYAVDYTKTGDYVGNPITPLRVGLGVNFNF